MSYEKTQVSGEATEVAVVEVSSTVKALEKEKAANMKRQLLLASKYPHALLDTLHFNEVANKFACNIKCQKCGDESRVVFTSDLFQCHLCENCAAAEKKARKAAARARRKEAQLEVNGHVGQA